MKSLFTFLSILMATVLTIVGQKASATGGTSGGGAFKSPSWIVRQNIEVLLDSDKVNDILKHSWQIRALELIGTKPGQTYTYKVTASYFYRESADCVLEVDVVNGNDATSPKAFVREVRKLTACTPPPPPPQAPSVLETHKDYFDLFKEITLDDQRPYQEYLDIARKYPAEKRRALREAMANSSQSQFHKVFTARSAMMKKAFAERPNATTAQMYLFLGEVMGLKVDGGGIVIPVLIALEIAPLFMVD